MFDLKTKKIINIWEEDDNKILYDIYKQQLQLLKNKYICHVNKIKYDSFTTLKLENKEITLKRIFENKIFESCVIWDNFEMISKEIIQKCYEFSK